MAPWVAFDLLEILQKHFCEKRRERKLSDLWPDAGSAEVTLPLARQNDQYETICWMLEALGARHLHTAEVRHFYRASTWYFSAPTLRLTIAQDTDESVRVEASGRYAIGGDRFVVMLQSALDAWAEARSRH